jgi:hypothetical protein
VHVRPAHFCRRNCYAPICALLFFIGYEISSYKLLQKTGALATSFEVIYQFSGLDNHH